ncbi:hypothetical protein PCASD_00973 [Puccinia coronata f. sp. avenae]|uniref:DDE Tnp4 domain-containing protein n=1 Tax=Puccinia coronata f. sp. avenae TaxID=200324 RepID=A0A2N5VMT1_9BASI|nr:hypothetical protein PCASD_00973 [Puccinia coronata f. sp. avenae]
MVLAHVPVSGGGPGLMHNSRVFQRSTVGQSLTLGTNVPRRLPPATFLIGDAGYPSNVDILVPYPSLVNPANVFFDFIQSSTRICVEQALPALTGQTRLLERCSNSRV